MWGWSSMLATINHFKQTLLLTIHWMLPVLICKTMPKVWVSLPFLHKPYICDGILDCPHTAYSI